MASNAFSGVGTTFLRGSVAIAEVNSISGPNLSRDTIDVTSLDSTGGYREFIAGIRDGGEVTLSMNFTMATYNDLKDDLESDVSVAYSVVLGNTNNNTFTFDAYVTSLGMAVNFDDKVQSDVSFKIDGQVTITS